MQKKKLKRSNKKFQKKIAKSHTRVFLSFVKIKIYYLTPPARGGIVRSKSPLNALALKIRL